MLLSPIQRVEVLCNTADVVGWIKPNTPAPISPALKPTIKAVIIMNSAALSGY